MRGEDRHPSSSKVEFDEKTGIETVTDVNGKKTVTNFGAPTKAEKAAVKAAAAAEAKADAAEAKAEKAAKK